MFDVCPNQTCDCSLAHVRFFFAENGDQLAAAAAILGGAAAAAKAKFAAARLDGCTYIDRRLKADLDAIHRLLTLAEIRDPDDPDGDFFPCLDPASRQVEIICLLTDRLQDLLSEIECGIAHPECAARRSAA